MVMTMSMKRERAMAAATFKATCLAVLDEVAAGGPTVLVTKRGRPVARVVPVHATEAPLDGLIVASGDLVSPIDEAWESA